MHLRPISGATAWRRHADLEDALLSVPQGPGHLTRLCDLTKRFLSAAPV